MDPQYDIYFAGEVLDGHDPAAVRAALGKLFKADDNTLDKLFSGKLLPIKRGCDEATAHKYKKAMERAGANPVVRPANGENEKPAPAPAEEKPISAAEKIAALAAAPDEDAYKSNAATAAEADNAEENAIDVAPPGADVLRPEERQTTEAVDVDISNLAVDEAAQRLSEEPPPPPAAPDTNHLTMGEVGETIPALDEGPPPVAPSTDHIGLAPSGTDFADCAPPEPQEPELDLSQLDVAPAGSDVLEAQYRGRKKPPAPDTDHLSLED